MDRSYPLAYAFQTYHMICATFEVFTVGHETHSAAREVQFFAGTGIGIRPQPATSAQPSRLGLKCSSEILHSESREARAASFGKRQLRDGAAGT